ncbi:MAG: serine hydrolase [Mycobacterium sp.]|uniref:serine hydrolase domain-containing protein n=1 Tax=Mycobacterium sp. TaxID=1785 RepID=UPI001ED689F0|nr:serine hydrolase [Mycobacterium sp.]MBW0016188.1 serine hydrolase [Mycobacterium sp.]
MPNGPRRRSRKALLDKHLRSLPLLAAVVLLLVACGGRNAAPAAKPTSQTTTIDAALQARSQGTLDEAIKSDEPGCSAAVGRAGTVVWTGVRGVADTTTGDLITARTVFDIASVSKQFTATAVLLLAQAGKLAIDDTLAKHMPELPAWAATVSLTQLMHHTSGIPDYTGLLEEHGYRLTDRTTEDEALQAVSGVQGLNFKPGNRFEYSNSNYLLLGEIVHRASGQPLPQYLSAAIFQPLRVTMVLDPVGKIADKALSYAKTDDGYQLAGSAWEQIGDGGIQTTPSQLVRWADNYRTGAVGGKALLDSQLAGAVQTESGGADRYGAGIYLLANGALDHDGSWAGFVTAFRVGMDRRTSLAVSCNTDGQDPESLADSLTQLWM